MNDIASASFHAECATQANQGQGQAGLSAEQARRSVRFRLEQQIGAGAVSGADLDYLADSIILRRYNAGELICRQGVRAEAMGLVARGQVAQGRSAVGLTSPTLAQGKANSLLLPGSTFGEEMLVDGKPSSATLRAAMYAEVWFLQRAEYLAVADNYKIHSADHRGQVPRWLLLAAVAIIAFAAAAAGLVLAWPVVDELIGSPAATSEIGTEHATTAVAQIVAPLEGAIHQIGGALPVRAVVTADGLVRAELRVDGVAVAARGDPEPMAVPWVVELDWREVREGQHTLSIRAEQDNGSVLSSEPITVTVVPTGELAFASNREGDYAIYEMQSDGSNLRRASAGPDAARQPAWGQDGELSWAATPLDGRATVRGVSAARDEGMQLYEGRNPAWAADGKLAYDAEVKGISQVFASLVPGGIPHPITSENVYAGQPTWSPDGAQIAYVAKRDGNWDLWVVDLEGGAPRQLTDNPAMDWSPAWSPDGNRFAFVSDRSGSFQIYLMRVDGNELQAVSGFDRGAESPAWSPGGAWLVFVAYTGDGVGVDAREIYVMTANGEQVVRLTSNLADDTEPAWGGH